MNSDYMKVPCVECGGSGWHNSGTADAMRCANCCGNGHQWVQKLTDEQFRVELARLEQRRKR